MQLIKVECAYQLRKSGLDGMRAVTLPSYGGPDALVLADVPEPVAGPGGSSSTLPPPR
jgi:hypothetical protein